MDLLAITSSHMTSLFGRFEFVRRAILNHWWSRCTILKQSGLKNVYQNHTQHLNENWCLALLFDKIFLVLLHKT